MGKFLILLFVSSSVLAAKQIRNEIDRYILLKDRQLVEKALIYDEHDSFFTLDLNISSGLKELFGDVRDSTSESSSTAQVTGVTEALSKNVNTERQLFADFEFGIPLPYFTYKNLRFLPSLYYALDIGASISINNQDNPLIPVAQLYIQKNTKIGLHSKIKRMNKKGETYAVSLYQRARSDLSESRNATAIVNSSKLVNLDELNRDEKIYGLDLAFYKDKPDYRYQVEVRDLKLMGAGGDVETKIGNTPMVHIVYEKDYKLPSFTLSPFAGAHYRKKYSIFEAFYLGTKLTLKDDSPAKFIFKLDNHTINLNAGLGFDRFQFHYGLKTPYRNPQEDMWISATHQITMRFPF